MVCSHDIDGTLEHRQTHLQQPMDWNINATHTDTTMSTLPTHANLLHYTSSSEEESSSSGKPPSNQTIVGSTLDHGGLKHTTATHTPMQRNDEDNTYETDLTNLEQAEQSTVVIPSIPTVQEITRYVYDSPYDGLVTNPDTGAMVELRRSVASQFLVNNCKLPTMFCMLFGYPNFNNIHDQAPFCNAKQQLKSTWKVVNDNMKTEIHRHSYFLLKELPHDDNQYCEEKGLDNIEGFEVQPNDPYVVKQKKYHCHNAQQLLNDYKDQLRMCKEARDNLDWRIQMKHQVIDGLQDANEIIAAGSTPAPLQEITPRRSGSGKRKSPPSMVRMNLGNTEGDVEFGNGDGDITES